MHGATVKKKREKSS